MCWCQHGRHPGVRGGSASRPAYRRVGAGGRRTGDGQTRRLTARFVRYDLEREFMVADANVVAVVEGGCGRDAPPTHVDAVDRSQVGDHEAFTGVDDNGMVGTDFAVRQHHVVTFATPDTKGQPAKWRPVPRGVACCGARRTVGHAGRVFEGPDDISCGSLDDDSRVQCLLAQHLLV